MTEKVGFIGLGTMGQPMAGRIMGAGFPLTVWNKTASKTADLEKKGAKVAKSPKEVAAASDVIVSMIADGPALEAITFGDSGVAAGIKSGSVFIDMSTVDPESSMRVAKAVEAKGAKMLRAPVSGSTVLAGAGTLTILASGDKAAFDRCAKVFGAMGQKIFHVGPGDEARYLKLVLNMMVGTSMQMLAEALTFGKKAGLEWKQMLEIISASVVGSPLINYKAGPIADRNFKPAFTAGLMAKDFDLALKAGSEMGVAMPTIGLVRQFLAVLKSTGRGDLDFSGLILLMEDLAGIKDAYKS
jgi:3-hydroxyisobutyrate dehydrogenase-like beta-hydroxyacid dehydrogenase